MTRARLLAPLILLVLLTSVAEAAPREGVYAGVHLRTGDVVFQSIGGRLGRIIQGVTMSPLDHCGIVIVDGRGRVRVIEAVGPVREIDVAQWVRRGKDQKIAVYRPTGELANHVDQVIEAARAYLGRPYDIQYELDDAKIYCSELVWKAWRDAMEVELAPTETLGSMNWIPWTAHIMALTDGELPLDRPIVSPVQLTRSPLLRLVHTDFASEAPATR